MGDDIKVMVHNKHTADIIATGGQENDLKLWQLKNMDKPVFTAKNVCFIVLFTDICFIASKRFPVFLIITKFSSLLVCYIYIKECCS